MRDDDQVCSKELRPSRGDLGTYASLHKLPLRETAPLQ